MKDKFQELYDVLVQDRRESPWSRNCSFDKRLKELQKEIQELEQALENNDIKNLGEEMGDVLFDLLCMFVIAEEKDWFTTKETISNSIEKIKRRKPWIFGENKIKNLTPEEEERIWNQIKKKEKSTGHL